MSYFFESAFKAVIMILVVVAVPHFYYCAKLYIWAAENNLEWWPQVSTLWIVPFSAACIATVK